MSRPRRTSGRRFRSQRGLTLIELLLSLALVVLVTGFIIAGLSASRRAAVWNRMAEQDMKADTALQSLGTLIEAAVPVRLADDGRTPRLAFDGGSDALAFIASGDGFALRGGLWSVTIRLNDADLVAILAPLREGQSPGTDKDGRQRTVVLCSGVDHLAFSYFGVTGANVPADWHGNWTQAKLLPRLVALSIQVAGRTAPAAIVSQVRQSLE